MNALLPGLALAAVLLLAFVVFFFWYYGSPKYLEVGYRPDQPVEYSHKLHAGDLGMDCRYCHSQVERSRFANLPTTAVCMNCHEQVGRDNPKLDPVRESWNTGTPIEWIRVHQLPDYAYFEHATMLRAGVGCVECHGRVDQMEVVEKARSLSMGFCLDCHRDPKGRLRPATEVTNMDWKPGSDYEAWYEQHYAEKSLNPREECSACHR
jgi:hypothetical protein